MPVSWETDACFFVAFHLIPRILRHLISFKFYILLSFYLFECAVPQHLYFCALNFWCLYISFCAKAERPLKISWHERYDTTRSKTLNLELLRLFCGVKIQQFHHWSTLAFAPNTSCNFTAAASFILFPNEFYN